MSQLRTERVKPSRAARATVRRRRRGILLAIFVPILIASLAMGVWWLTTGGPLGGDNAKDKVANADQQLTVVAYRGEQTGVAVLASSRSGGRRPVVLVLPTNIIVSVPGHGTGPLSEALADGPQVAETTVANLLGLAFHHHGILTPAGLKSLTDAAGPLTVNLGTRVTLQGDAVGPGEARLSGQQVAAYLDGTGDPLEVTLRFEEVLGALLASAKADPGAMQDAAGDADDEFGAYVAKVPADTDIDELPVKDAGSGVGTMDEKAAETLIAKLFSKPTDQVASVVLLNGNGVPGIGGVMADRIVPAGFRVVVSTNATNFDFETTQIVVRSDKVLDAGRRLRSLLGVGQVSVGQSSTGLADITVLIGRDYTGE
jgi:hypothetical protein